MKPKENKGEKKREDLKTAKVLQDNERLADCAFYCQQAVEKALKYHWLKTEPELAFLYKMRNRGVID